MKFLLSTILFVAATSTNAEQLRGSTAQDERQAQAATVGRIKELRWVNADSNQRNFVIDGSFVVPINVEEEFADTIDGFEVPPVELTMEAITEGSVGSVKFSFNGKTVIENAAPWALCANSGSDFFACQDLRQNGGKVTAQAFAGRGATGASSPEILTYIRYIFRAPPAGGIHIVNSKTDVDLGFCDGAVVNLTQTPEVGFFLDLFGGRFRWTAKSARFDYEKGQRIVVENSNPLAFPGNSGTDYFGIVPAVGNRTISATIHSKVNLKGQNDTLSCDFTVVV